MAHKRAFVFNGGPGCAKGTDAKVFCKLHGWLQFEMGPFLLQRRPHDAELDAEMRRTTDVGGYVSDKFMLPILEERLDGHHFPDEFIADGITRTGKQAEMVLHKLHQLGYRIITINYDIPEGFDHVFMERMAFRKRKGETPEVQRRRVKEFRTHNPDVLRVFDGFQSHFYRTIDARKEHEFRLQDIRTIMADAPGTRPVRDGVALHMPVRGRQTTPPGMVCSDH
jgi:adenylate kinase